MKITFANKKLLQFENVTKIPTQFWINHQRGYDEFIASEKRKPICLLLDIH